MTIGSNVLAQDSAVGDDSTSSFSVPFPTWTETDLEVYVIRESDGMRLNLDLTTDYSLSVNRDDLTLINASQEWVTVTGKLKTGYSLFIEYTSEAYQSAVFTDLGRVSPLKFEGALDRLAMQMKAIKNVASRALSLSGGTPIADLPPFIGNAGKIVKVNDDEDGFDYGVDVQDIFDARDEAQASATASATSATASATSATASATSASASNTSKLAAATSASNAATSAAAALASENNAATSEGEAAQWAKYYAFSQLKTITFADSPYTINYIADEDAMINVDTSGGNVIVNLPDLNSMPSSDWKAGLHKATADVNTITVTPYTGQQINNSAGLLLSSQTFGVALSDDTPSNWDGLYVSFGTFAGVSGALPSGGIAGDVLSKNSAVDGDASWKAPVDNSIVNALIFG
jgi:hypothetical protein